MGLGTSDTDTIHPIKLRGGIRRWLSNFGAYVATLFRTLFVLLLDRSIRLVRRSRSLSLNPEGTLH
jgi:hypothetical protein